MDASIVVLDCNSILTESRSEVEKGKRRRAYMIALTQGWRVS